MIKGRECCSYIMKKELKELVVTKELDENFETSTKSWNCDNNFVDRDFKVRAHCHINGSNKRFKSL